jgi:beta-lactamase superfamily II metal-dependent hydrolase
MSALKVRLYNVLFGDGILVEVPDRDPATGQETLRRILIDVGNAPSKAGGNDAVLPPVVQHVLDTLGGQALDLYVMTHEHLDHVQGLRYANLKGPLKDQVAQRLAIDYAWFTASANPRYGETHPEARKAMDAARAMYTSLERQLGLLPAAERARLGAIHANNNPNATGECVKFLLELTARSKVSWLYRGMPKAKLRHPFKEARFKIWAPEEDTSIYYGRLQELAMAWPAAPIGTGTTRDPLPPPGVDAGAFQRLVTARSQGVGDALLQIDKAANNTSVVFALEWRGWRLLFAGDAEIKSWKVMAREQVIEPVHFLKVSHHGSHNGTPDGAIFEALLPAQAPDDRQRYAYISSADDTYGGIPHAETNARLAERAVVASTRALRDDQPYLEAVFPDLDAARAARRGSAPRGRTRPRARPGR